MQSDFQITQLSTDAGPASHRYYDVPVESPSAERITYFQWDGPQPGPGWIVVADADSANPTRVARTEGPAIGHVGGLPTWLDDNTLAYAPDGADRERYAIVSLDDPANPRPLDAGLRSYCEATGQAAAFRDRMPGSDTPEPGYARPILGLADVQTEQFTPLLTVTQACRLHPDGDGLDPARLNFMNVKFAPDGQSTFVVFTDEVSARQTGRPRTVKSLILTDLKTGQSRWLGEFTHHPMWTPDGAGVIAHLDNPRGSQDLVRYALDASRPEVLLPDFAGVHTSLNIAATHAITDTHRDPKGTGGVWLTNLATGQRVELARGTHDRHDHEGGTHIHPQFSRDESRIFFAMRDTGQAQLYALHLPQPWPV